MRMIARFLILALSVGVSVGLWTSTATADGPYPECAMRVLTDKIGTGVLRGRTGDTFECYAVNTTPPPKMKEGTLQYYGIGYQSVHIKIIDTYGNILAEEWGTVGPKQALKASYFIPFPGEEAWCHVETGPDLSVWTCDQMPCDMYMDTYPVIKAPPANSILVNLALNQGGHGKDSDSSLPGFRQDSSTRDLWWNDGCPVWCDATWPDFCDGVDYCPAECTTTE